MRYANVYTRAIIIELVWHDVFYELRVTRENVRLYARVRYEVFHTFVLCAVRFQERIQP